MLRNVFSRLAHLYEKRGMDLNKALQVWAMVGYSPEDIQEQVMNDINHGISLKMAKELHTLSLSKLDALPRKSDMDGRGRKRLMPKSYQEARVPQAIKFSSLIQNNLVKVGENLYQHKKTKKYWTLKESIGKDGKRGLYLVAIEVE